MISQHNYYRQKHGVNDLINDSVIASDAQTYALKLAKSNTGLQHSNTNYGENLAYQMDSRFKLNKKTCEGEFEVE